MDSFLEIFKFQTQRYADIIEVHPGSILDYRSPASKIGLLFIDVAKTLEIQKHLFKHFFRSLSVDGILIQQDYHHAYHPYIHVAMEYLADYFEITHSRVGASRVYRLLKLIPDVMYQRLIDYDFSNDEVYQLMNKCIERSPADERALLTILLARHLMLNNDSRLTSVVTRFVEAYATTPGFDWFVREMKSAVGAAANPILADLGYI
jgi:hypothetical protein